VEVHRLAKYTKEVGVLYFLNHASYMKSRTLIEKRDTVSLAETIVDTYCTNWRSCTMASDSTRDPSAKALQAAGSLLQPRKKMLLEW